MPIEVWQAMGAIIAWVAVLCLIGITGCIMANILSKSKPCPECRKKRHKDEISIYVSILEDLYKAWLSYGNKALPEALAIEAGIIALKEKRKKEEESLENWDRW
jgi:hypothetical protein